MSVCSNPVVWLLNSHVILGTGAPTDLQEMVPLFPSAMIRTESLRAVVLASSVECVQQNRTNFIDVAIVFYSATYPVESLQSLLLHLV